MDRRPQTGLLVATAGLVVAVGAVVLIVRLADGGGVSLREPRVEQPTSVLDELLPDRPSPPADTAAMATPDPAGAATAPQDLVLAEAAWAATDLGDTQLLALVENRADVAYANVALEAVVLDREQTEIASLPAFLNRIDPGRTVAVAGTVAAVDPASIDAIELEITARGSLPALEVHHQFSGVEWSQDDQGTVKITGVVQTAPSADLVGLVAVIRDDSGRFLAAGVGLVSGSPEPQVFDLLAFPAGTAAQVDMYASG